MSGVVHVKVNDPSQAESSAPKQMPTGRTIVVAVDDSETSRHAFEYAVKHMFRPGDQLRLIHVQPFHDVTDVVATSFVAVPIYSAGEVREESLKTAKHYARLCKERGLSTDDYKEDILLEDGSIGKAICKYMEKLPQSINTDVVLVVGSRELGFFGRAFLGSASEYCVQHCHCPVTVAKLPPA